VKPGFRAFPVDGGLLYFDRDTGTNVLVESAETAGFRLRAPRVVQFAITNRCNLTCRFCSRDLEARSAWTAETAFELLAALAERGVLEVAFGGGEPFAFPRFVDLMRRLHAETPLAASATTNGMLLTPARLASLRGAYGQIRLSLYEDNDWRRTLRRLVDAGARFGVNYLVTPARLATLAALVAELVDMGCRDVLLLSYNGRDPAMHLSAAETRGLETSVRALGHALRGRCEIKLDVCWGERLAAVPRLFRKGDCGAGREFLSITSDRKMAPCSFHDARVAFADADELLAIWAQGPAAFRRAAPDPGCAREATSP
jgi:MoaA/NifB/PqqE/SkfB family radical SAM enzyme